MKFILTVILSVFFTAAFASGGGDIRITPGKNSALQVTFASPVKKDAGALVTIQDARGKVISEKSIRAISGENTVTIGNAETMSEGNYIIKVTIGTQTLQTNFTVWK